ncbi:phosphodiester glycosidase family protein [Oculatella sp. LEGE 06141]|nr:phosphodiester glycosidase family protein [Oculatella sp. LEGE 06141]
MKLFIKTIGSSLLILPFVFYGIPHFLRPARTAETRSLFQGIVYQRQIHASPRPFVTHLISVDLTAPGVRAFVAPGTPTPDQTETTAYTVSEFLTQFDLQLAVNASFFYPFTEKTPWNYYPHSGDRANVVGQAISNGTEYSAAETNWVVLCFLDHQRAHIFNQAKCPNHTKQAVAGNRVLVANGKAVEIDQHSPDQVKPYARVAVAIDQSGQKLWLIVVDGKQRFYSQGVTLPELAEIVIQLGADAAINLDGGGSTTLALETAHGATLLNAPIHTKIPMRERPVANILGFYALPVRPE